MVKIDKYQSTDFETVKTFVESIQEHERVNTPELKKGCEIGNAYTAILIENITKKKGSILIARNDANKPIGFICAWIDEDDDYLLKESFRSHAYISDIFVVEEWRGKGVAKVLLQTIEIEMRARNCERVRICTKSSNLSALKCYEANGYKPYEVILTKSLHKNIQGKISSPSVI